MKKGFTISEVLIMLGLIGVVAAITIPILKSKIENYILRNRFLKQYASYSLTIEKIEFENGGIFHCYFGDTSECKAFWNEFLRNCKVIKKCMYVTENCSFIYKTKTEVKNSGGVWNAGSDLNDVNPEVYYLFDGSIIFHYPGRYTCYFFVDINGIKGPNKWGYDLFSLTLSKQQNKSFIRITDFITPHYEKGGRRVKNILLNDYNINSNRFSE